MPVNYDRSFSSNANPVLDMATIARRAATAFALSFGIAFATAASAQSMDRELHDSFKAGTLRIQPSLFGSGVGGTAALKKLYDEKNWEQLVPEVISKKFLVDTYYFYLGAAAEAMGYTDAAAIYYDLAATQPQNKRCVELQAFTDTCVGFRFPGDALKRKSHLAVAVAGESKSYALGEGPTVTELVGSSPMSIDELRAGSLQSSKQRGKFETEEEYQARFKGIVSGRLVAMSINTNDRRNCLTEYNHATSEYVATKCLVVSETIPMLTKSGEGESFRLSNLIDSREIRRLVTEKYFLVTNFVWNQKLKLSREDAQRIDEDLMVGVVLEDFSITRECSECESRKLRENLAGVAESAGVLSNRRTSTADIDWKKDAFLKGSISETWIYSVKPSKVVMYVVFRRSDNKVIYSFRPA